MISLPLVTVRCDGRPAGADGQEPCRRSFPITLPAHGLPAVAMRQAIQGQTRDWFIGEQLTLCPDCCAAALAAYRQHCAAEPAPLP